MRPEVLHPLQRSLDRRIRRDQGRREEVPLAPGQAKTHVSRDMVKLGARDRAQLVVFAYEAGLVSPGWTN
jgi:hypothetical protein